MQRNYRPEFELKYGCNPQQQDAAIFSLDNQPLPFSILNGRPGYINLLDALNAWQLVHELDQALDLPAATSFKHVSPAGAAIANTLKGAYLKARGADPMSSFGDFIALSRTVDQDTAQAIKPLVSDGIIAPGYTPEALEILTAKKKGNYVVLQADPNYQAPKEEYREVYGVVFRQDRNTTPLNETFLLSEVVTQQSNFPESAKQDLVLAAITLKYTQSNSVGYALDGQMIGIGAGQQSRIDCTKLAGRKADIWYLRQHPKVQSLPFKEGVKQVDRTNAQIAYVEGDMTPKEQEHWQSLFHTPPEELTTHEKKEWLQGLRGVSLASDAFFPFRDNLDQASKRGVSYVVQPGGSMRDDIVIEAANEYQMAMAFSKIRLFHH